MRYGQFQPRTSKLSRSGPGPVRPHRAGTTPADFATRQLDRSRRIAGIGQLIAGAEGLVSRRLHENGNLLSGRFHEAYPEVSRRFPRVARVLDSEKFPIVLDGMRIVSGSASVLFGRSRLVSNVLPLMISATGYLDSLRTHLGRDGSDQMQETLAFAQLLTQIGTLGRGDKDLTLRLINAELAISYVAAGLVKLVSYDWRRGRAIRGILHTSSYGHPGFVALLDRHITLARIIEWATIVGETAYPIIYVLPVQISRILAPIATAFHLSTAVFMGLPRFMWSFGAAHPAMIYVIETGQRVSPRCAQ